MRRGSGFGELALLYGLPRSASCVAITDVVVWVLDRRPFKHIVIKEQVCARALLYGCLLAGVSYRDLWIVDSQNCCA